MLFLPVMLCVGQFKQRLQHIQNINFVYIFPNNGHLSKVAFVIPHGLTVVGRFDCIWIDQNLQKLILEEIVFIILETFDGVTRSEVSCFQLYQGLSGWRSGITLGSPAATRVQYSASAGEMVMWSPSQTGGFPLGTPVSSHTKTTQTKHRCQQAWLI